MVNDSMETFCNHSSICLSRGAHAEARASFEAPQPGSCTGNLTTEWVETLKGYQDPARLSWGRRQAAVGQCWSAKWQGFARRLERLPVCQSYLCLSLISLCKYLRSQLVRSSPARKQCGIPAVSYQLSAACSSWGNQLQMRLAQFVKCYRRCKQLSSSGSSVCFKLKQL